MRIGTPECLVAVAGKYAHEKVRATGESELMEKGSVRGADGMGKREDSVYKYPGTTVRYRKREVRERRATYSRANIGAEGCLEIIVSYRK